MIRLKNKVKLRKDTKQWERMEKNLRSGKDVALNVGWFGGEHPTGQPIPLVAAWTEEGHMTGWGGYAPPRPAVRVGFVNQLPKDRWMEKYIPLIDMIARGNLTWEGYHLAIGEEMKDRLKESIRIWSKPPNAPSTIAKKGFNDPWIDSLTVYESVDYKLGKKGEQ